MAAVLGAILIAILGIGWGVGAAIVSSPPGADLDAVKDLAGDRTPGLTSLAHIVSALGSDYVVYPLAFLGCVWLARRRRVRAAIAFAVSTAGGVIIANLDKLLVERARPPVHHLEHVSSWSFPSGHATESAAFYLAMLILVSRGQPRRPTAIVATVVTLVLVAAIAVSRVYLGVHYPSDVAVGLALGATWSGVAMWLILSMPLSRAGGPRRVR